MAAVDPISNIVTVATEIFKKIGSLPFKLVGMLPNWFKWSFLFVMVIISIYLIYKFITNEDDHFVYEI